MLFSVSNAVMVFHIIQSSGQKTQYNIQGSMWFSPTPALNSFELCPATHPPAEIQMSGLWKRRGLRNEPWS